MSGFELNKIVASILLASVIAMLVGVVTNILYKPSLNPASRGYAVETNEGNATAVKTENEPEIDIASLIEKANADAGKEVIKKCLSCHSFDKNGAHKVGPNLWNIAGNDKAKASGYKYSSALTAIGGKWSDEDLYRFLHKPSAYAPGTKMSFAGLSKPEDIANVIAFLKKLAHD